MRYFTETYSDDSTYMNLSTVPVPVEKNIQVDHQQLVEWTKSDVCRRLQTFADICRHLQTFADVCRCLQTFADDCRRLGADLCYY